ncbi:MAG: DUF1517 domain-containing protein [Pseudanabaenaceae cyanobacterium bins.68]|nr:DUF1517 domain-containing protein [Pseudanabaenaceae cyanobacterium bins.68]
MNLLNKVGKIALALCLVAVMIFGSADQALARRGGGRVGGSGFRAAPRLTRPTRVNTPRVTNYNSYNYNSGFSGFSFFPFLPFMVGGGGSLFSLLVVAAIAAAVLQVFRGVGEAGISNLNSKVTVAKVRVGLLAGARSIQSKLTDLAESADTSSTTGLAIALRESCVALMRQPEYWVYGQGDREVVGFEQAEQKFQTLAAAERTKLSAEVVSNVNNRKQLAVGSASSELDDPSEYIVVTLLVAASGKLELPSTIRNAEQLQQAFTSLASVPAEQLLALELLWEPQSTEYTLTTDQVLTVYPQLVRL